MDRRVFVERARTAGVARLDGKRHLILDQKVSPRKAPPGRRAGASVFVRESAGRSAVPVFGQGVPARKTSPPNAGDAIDAGFPWSRRRTLLWAGLSLTVLASLIPLYVNLQSHFWEKRWSAREEGDPLYGLFVAQPGAEHGKTPLDAGGAAGEGLAPAPPPPDAPPVPVLKIHAYTVRPGDSLFGIAARFGVPVDGILSANNLKNARLIRQGTVLRVPSVKGIMYRVKKGDNLSSISKRYGVRVNDIADINDLPSETIRPGQELFVPGASLSEWERAAALGTFFKSPSRGRIVSRVGFRIDPFTKKLAYHAGIDIAGRVGTPVKSAQYGRVSFAGEHGGYGKTVIVVHPDGYRTLYAHLDRIFVKRGQAVKLEEKIGTIGNTGRTTGPHLHFEVHRYDTIVDPLKVMKSR
jgi:murein DD-endopeptidase MepM/ murein hydrolase activator NlpD